MRKMKMELQVPRHWPQRPVIHQQRRWLGWFRVGPPYRAYSSISNWLGPILYGWPLEMAENQWVTGVKKKTIRWSYGPPFVTIVRAHFVGFCFFFCCRGERILKDVLSQKKCFHRDFWNHPWNGNPICSQPVIEGFCSLNIHLLYVRFMSCQEFRMRFLKKKPPLKLSAVFHWKFQWLEDETWGCTLYLQKTESFWCEHLHASSSTWVSVEASQHDLLVVTDWATLRKGLVVGGIFFMDSCWAGYVLRTIFGGIKQTMQMYGNFEGCPEKNGAFRLGWCLVFWPMYIASCFPADLPWKCRKIDRLLSKPGIPHEIRQDFRKA